MHIAEAIEAKNAAEKEISAILDLLQKKTGLTPMEIDLTHVDSTRMEDSRRRVLIAAVKIKMEMI